MKAVLCAVVLGLAGILGCAKSVPRAPDASPETVTDVKPIANWAETTEPKPHVTTEAAKKKFAAELRQLAVKSETEVLAKKDALMAEAVAEHDADVANYQFRVSRWGDWLEISIGRKRKDDKPQKFSTSINLGLVTTVRLESGHIPDSEGTLTYAPQLEPDINPPSGVPGFSWSCGDYEIHPAPKGYHYVARPDLPTAEYHQLFNETPRPENTMYMNSMVCGLTYPIDYKTEHFVRFATDDKIYFDGIATMYAPAGLGEKVYREILAAKDTK